MKKTCFILMPFLVFMMFLSCKKDHGSGLPVVVTTAVSNITNNSASSGGDVTSAGGSAVEGRGITWDTSATISATNQTLDGTGTGNFSSSITGLFPATKYYVRAYAVNATGTAYGNVVQFTSSFVPSKYTVTTLAGSGASGSGDGTGTGASFSGPDGACVDLAGNVYIADFINKKVRKVSPGGVVTTLAVTDGGPSDVAVDALGNVYVSESTYKILKITPGGAVSTFAGSGVQGSKDSTGTGASFNSPFTLAIDLSGNLYVADGNAVRKISPIGLVTTHSRLTTTLPLFQRIIAAEVDKAGTVYLTDGFMIKKIDTLGGGAFIAGTQGSDDGTGGAAGFNNITELKVDQAGNIYVSDAGNNKIRLVTPSGLVTTLAGTGAKGSVDGNAAAATFLVPTGLALDATGNIYVADGSNKIRKISL